MAGAAALIASVVVATSAAGKAAAASAGAAAAAVAARMRGGVANIPRARVLPFTGAHTHARFAPCLGSTHHAPPGKGRGLDLRFLPAGSERQRL